MVVKNYNNLFIVSLIFSIMGLGNFLNGFKHVRENPLHASQLREGVVLKYGEIIFERGRFPDFHGKTHLYIKTIQRISDMPDTSPNNYFKRMYPRGAMEFHYRVNGDFFPRRTVSALIGPSVSDAFYQEVRRRIAA